MLVFSPEVIYLGRHGFLTVPVIPAFTFRAVVPNLAVV